MPESTVRILVVDDDMFTAELTGLALEAAGFDPVVAEGGMEAMEKLATDGPFAAVVSDMNMPLMTGAELIEELRREGHAFPCVLLTGEDAAALAGGQGVSAVLQKDERFQEALPELLLALLGR